MILRREKNFCPQSGPDQADFVTAWPSDTSFAPHSCSIRTTRTLLYGPLVTRLRSQLARKTRARLCGLAGLGHEQCLWVYNELIIIIIIIIIIIPYEYPRC